MVLIWIIYGRYMDNLGLSMAIDMLYHPINGYSGG